jgi:hypothetical protein
MLGDGLGEKQRKTRKNMAAKKRSKKTTAKRKSPKKRAAKKSKASSGRTIVARNVVKREKGYLYFVDGSGNVAKTKMKRGASRGHRTCR